MTFERHVEIDPDKINTLIRFAMSQTKDPAEVSGLIAFALIVDQKGKGITWDQLLENLEQAWETIQPENLVKAPMQ